MKPLTNGGGLVDKREKLLFEVYKNKAIKSAEVLRKEIKKDYGFEPSSDLYREILNYQIKKYGKSIYLRDIADRDYVQNFHIKNRKLREHRSDLRNRTTKESRFIERVEKRKRNVSR